jgi:hypothetical protein
MHSRLGSQLADRLKGRNGGGFKHGELESMIEERALDRFQFSEVQSAHP